MISAGRIAAGIRDHFRHEFRVVEPERTLPSGYDSFRSREFRVVAPRLLNGRDRIVAPKPHEGGADGVRPIIEADEWRQSLVRMAGLQVCAHDGQTGSDV